MSNEAIQEDAVVEEEGHIEESHDDASDDNVSSREAVVNRIIKNREEEVKADMEAEEDSAPEPEEAEQDVAEDLEADEETPEMVTIKVDGREQTVPKDDVYSHGIKALQKESAADLRLKEATIKLKQVQEREENLNRLIEDQEAKETDATYEDFKKDYAAALVEDEDKAAEMLSDVVRRIDENDKRFAELQSGVQANAQFTMDQQVSEKRRLTNLFKTEFPELAKDPLLHTEVNNATIQLRQQNPDLPHEDIVMAAGKMVKERFQRVFGGTGSDEPEDNPVTLKRAMPKPVKRASGKQPAKKEAKTQTSKEIIADMRKRRAAY